MTLRDKNESLYQTAIDIKEGDQKEAASRAALELGEESPEKSHRRNASPLS